MQISSPKLLLTINGGSSSIKFAGFQLATDLQQVFHGGIERIGLPGTKISFQLSLDSLAGSEPLEAGDHASAVEGLLKWLQTRLDFSQIGAVGHRVVHGMSHQEPELVTESLLVELRGIQPIDPEHLPRQIELIDAFWKRLPGIPHFACFDTSFHHDLPRVARLLPIPRRFEALGIRRYGFHGLSYAFLMMELARLEGNPCAHGRVILLHLGSGCSLAAVLEGRSIDTTMGFTPTSGIPMGTRTGDLDPGIAAYLARTQQLSTEQFYRLANHESGMLGISETSPDVRDLLAAEAGDVRAREALDYFCYQTRKWIGSFAAALGGLDTLVFSAGIGENCAPVRERICAGLQFLGLEIEPARNQTNDPIISKVNSRITVRVIRTDEERMMAILVSKELAKKTQT